MPAWLTVILDFLKWAVQLTFDAIQWMVASKLRACVLAAFIIGFCLGGFFGAWKVRLVGDENGMGWINDPDEVKAIVATFKNPFFGDIAKNLIQADEDKDALLYKAYKKATGRDWRPHNQDGVGSCVGQGMSGAIEIGDGCDIANGERSEPKFISAATCYALSRKVNGMLGRGDGSTGAAAAKAVMEYGNLSCEDAGDDNFNTSIGSKLCKEWGRAGVPSDKLPIAAKHKVRTASQVRTPEEVRAALVNGYPVTIASNVGFEGRGGFKRDANGFCYAGGTWSHQMFVGGYRADKKAFLVFQSWGDDSPPGGKSLDQPDGTFWITWSDMQRITKGGECYAISGFEGFPKRDLDWLIAAPTPRPVYVKRTNLVEIFALAP